MDYKKPSEVVSVMVQSGIDKVQLSTTDLMIRGILAGAILGFGTTLAITASIQTGLPVIGAAIFPACFIIVVLMGFELVTGNFAILPTAFLAKKITLADTLKNWLLVFFANLLGGLLYAVLFWISLTQLGHDSGGPLAAAIVKIAETKTGAYAHFGSDGIITLFTKGILCNWMVTFGVVMAMTSTSTLGKIFAAWLPIFIFFAQGFEHAVVNMFIIPAGMMLGAKVSFGDWWFGNQLPVTFGNIAGGVIFTALALYITYSKKKSIQSKHIHQPVGTTSDVE
ncbi:formate/nitrite transporter [Chitinophaga skermanii]|uniref:Formate/nitrite transporter n=1 Tax=Chitinophaga skermanii TaxID=331697 RepID=A0A327QJ48_9BACT|nr:formate/nitrite transporter family protein [Chitinophaga skermanii]RAJ04291.1 formate/nitrite transporter [Chitinophaga skermanii]